MVKMSKVIAVDFTDEEIRILKNLLESKDKEVYSVNKNFHTVWFQSESSDAELRIAFPSTIRFDCYIILDIIRFNDFYKIFYCHCS